MHTLTSAVSLFLLAVAFGASAVPPQRVASVTVTTPAAASAYAAPVMPQAPQLSQEA